MKLVSVIIPFYKKSKFFKKSIESVLRQSYSNFEIIVIFDDDDLNDLLLVKKAIKKYKKITLINNGKNLGVAKSRNNGLKIAKGSYVAFLDSDDIWDKNKLKKQIKFMKKNKIKFSHTSYKIVDENNNFLSFRKAKNKTNYKELLNSCDIALSTVIMHRSLLKYGLFPNLKTKEDYALWLKLGKKKIIFYGIQEVLMTWLKSGNSLSSSMFQKLFDAFRVYFYFEKLNFFVSLVRVFILSYFYLKKSYFSR